MYRSIEREGKRERERDANKLATAHRKLGLFHEE